MNSEKKDEKGREERRREPRVTSRNHPKEKVHEMSDPALPQRMQLVLMKLGLYWQLGESKKY